MLRCDFNRTGRISATAGSEYSNLNVSKEDDKGWMELTYMKGKKRVFKLGKMCIDDSKVYTYKYNGVLIKIDLNTMEILERGNKRVSPDRLLVIHLYYDEEWQDIIKYAYMSGDKSFCVNDIVNSSVLRKQIDQEKIYEILSLMCEYDLLKKADFGNEWTITERGKYNFSRINLYINSK